MISFPCAKINIGLHILQRRPDNYHDIETLFVPIALYDILEIIPATDAATHFAVSGLALAPITDAENLVMQAVHKFADHTCTSPALQIHLHKQIPAGAGLGGGSSDASFTLRALNQLYNSNLSQAAMQMLASEIGSDCAFFISPQPAIGSGRGEILHPFHINLSGHYIVLLLADIHISTAWAFSKIKPRVPAYALANLLRRPYTDWQQSIVNDFQKPVFQYYPQLARGLAFLYESGAWYASLSGSGSALYGIFDHMPTLPSHWHKWPILITKTLANS